MTIRILLFTMLPILCIAQVSPKEDILSNNNPSIERENMATNRNAQYNLEEIKVRWKKAALENCTGVPCVVAPSFTCGTSTVTDFDGNAYNTVAIGTQCWTKENLKVTKYNDGTAIPDETSNTTTWGGLLIGVRAFDPIDPSYVQTYGYLYNWFAAKGITVAGSTSYKNICPLGWHVPSDSEWTILIKSIDPTAIDMALTPTYQSTTAGENMKLNGAPWNSLSVVSNNSTGFSVLPAGQRANSFMTGATLNAYFWSSTFDAFNRSFARRFSSALNFVERTSQTYTEGFSIRCLKD